MNAPGLDRVQHHPRRDGVLLGAAFFADDAFAAAAFRFATFALISSRGTDVSSIASKIVVCYIRNLLRIKPSDMKNCLFAPLRVLNALLGIPILLVALILGHCGILFGLGSMDDPLGYTIIVKK